MCRGNYCLEGKGGQKKERVLGDGDGLKGKKIPGIHGEDWEGGYNSETIHPYFSRETPCP